MDRYNLSFYLDKSRSEQVTSIGWDWDWWRVQIHAFIEKEEICCTDRAEDRRPNHYIPRTERIGHCTTWLVWIGQNCRKVSVGHSYWMSWGGGVVMQFQHHHRLLMSSPLVNITKLLLTIKCVMFISFGHFVY